MLTKVSSGGLMLAVVWLLLLSTFLPYPQAVSLAQDPPPETWPDRRAVDPFQDLPHLAPGEPSPEVASVGAAEAVPAWSRLVFESLRDGNWEIYRANADGSNQVRLTHDSGSDVTARLNRGCTRIAFASNRTGSYEIYTMNLDGSGVTRLTFNDSHDLRPSWSPDGTRIAFDSYRDGQAEIYVMNANGSNQTRLTQNPAWDGEPVWSPDGTKIAFTSYRNSVYRIWRMNASGSNQVQLSDQAYSEHPAWSPDGSLIAFDADGNGDGWQELWTMNADGSGESQRYDPSGGEVDAWVGSWSADGRYVAFARVSWIYYSGYWFWTTSFLDAWDSQSGGVVRLSSQGEDMYPQWQTTDVAPPTSRVSALPSESPGPFTVSWSGQDSGPAGLASYDVQVRDGAGGSWTNWRLGTTGTTAAYPGLGGHTYYFRSRARDNAGNVEAWPQGADAFTTVEALPPTSSVTAMPAYLLNGATISWAGTDRGGSGISSYDVQFRDQAGGDWTDWQVGTTATSAAFTGTAGHTYDLRSRATDGAGNIEAWPGGNGDASTTLYTWGIRGVARDNTGAPVAGAVPATSPEAMEVIPSGLDGTYAAYVAAGAGAYTSSWAKSGYGSLPETAFDAGHDAVLDLVMPPADNVVVNWGFEDGAQAWPGWQAGGTLPISITTEVRHTGSQAVEMGQACPYPCITDPEPIFEPGYSSTDLVADSEGNLYTLWTNTTSLWYHIRTPDGTWSAPSVILPQDPDVLINLPRLAIDHEGTLHVVWEDRNYLYYSWQEPSGSWTAPAEVFRGSGDFAGPTGFGLDSRGGLHVICWGPADSRYLERLPSGEWQPPITVNEASGQYGPALAVGPDDTVHLVWHEWQDAVFYRARRPDGTWTVRTRLSTGHVSSQHGQQIIVDSVGRPHVFWSGDSYGLYATQDANGAWLPAVELPKARGTAGMAIDDTGMLYMVGTCSTAADAGTYFRQRDPDTGWTDPVQLSANYWASPEVAFDGLGIFHTIWEDLGQPQYQTTRRADEGAMATLSQSLTIPGGMQSPVLSLFYQQQWTLPTGGSGLRVSLSDGVSTTPLLSVMDPGSWAAAYADLQPWAGQQVTVTVGLHQAAGDPYAKLFLDEVTLGSAHPDLWVDKAGPPAAAPGEQVTFLITYGNRAGVGAAGVTVTDLLPPELPFVSADPPPTTVTPYLTWAVGDLPPGSGPTTITLIAGPALETEVLTNTVEIGSASAELETLNNEAQARVWIGWQVYLPVVLRED